MEEQVMSEGGELKLEVRPHRAPVVVLEPSPRWRLPSFAEIWEYRDLLYFLVWRDVKIRYKQTFFGAAWAIMQPLMSMLVFTIFFGRLAKMPSDGVPYPAFNYCALVPWTLFSNALVSASNSVVSSQALIKKVYFPRVLVPLGAVLEQVVDFAIAFTVLIILTQLYKLPISPRILVTPLLAAFAVMTAFAVGVWFAALNALYRDVRYTVPFLMQIWMFASPVVYPATLVQSKWQVLYGLNPMVGVIEGFRWALLGTHAPPGPMMAASFAMVCVVLFGGLLYFRNIERSMADVL